jgi:hypothetical protein
MKRYVLILVFSLITTYSIESNAMENDPCKAIALRDILDIGNNPESKLKRGEWDTNISGFERNKTNGVTYFCSHGGSCYPSHIIEKGKKVQVLKLVDYCRIGVPKNEDSADEEVYYNVELIASKAPHQDLEENDWTDIWNELNDTTDLNSIQSCSSGNLDCVGVVTEMYFKKPDSACAKEVRAYLEGDLDAGKKLVKMARVNECK